uniref:Methyltranfer_dom domain-containing protein n=1 Tax=Steinernema glaseri TaxID=37863 RepID=A0A1I7YSU5_9BILA
MSGLARTAFVVFLVLCSVVLFLNVFSKEGNMPRYSFTELIRVEQNELEDQKEETVSPELVEIYKRQISGRKALLASLNQNTKQYYDLYNVLAPEVFCPGLVRIGRLSDGGKWLCNPQKIPYPCVVYSLGVNNEFSFDSELYAMTKAIDKVGHKACHVRIVMQPDLAYRHGLLDLVILKLERR